MPVVSRETFALPANAITQTLVRALGVVMASIVNDVASSVGHQRKAFRGPKRVNSRVGHDDTAPVSNGKRCIEITLGCINVSLSKRTSPCSVQISRKIRATNLRNNKILESNTLTQ
jgi:hypothetical protein